MGQNFSVGFTVAASVEGFKRGMMEANNSVKSLKEGMREFDGGKLVRGLGVMGIVEGFRMTIDAAQEARKAAQETGTAIDDNTASVARYGDAWDGIKDSIKGAAVSALGYVTRLGETLGGFINSALGRSEQMQTNAEAGARAAEDAEKRLAEARKENSPEKIRAAEEELGKLRRQNYLESLTNEARWKALLAERTKAYEELDSMIEGTPAYVKKSLEIEKLRTEVIRAASAVQKDYDDAAKKADDDKQKAAEALKRAHEADVKVQEHALKLATDYYDATREAADAAQALANGVRDQVSSDLATVARSGSPQAAKAQYVQWLEKQAKEQNLQGNLSGALATQAKANEARSGITALSGGERDPLGGVKEQVAKSNEHLAKIAQSLEPAQIQ